jgi:glutathione S-transferase
MNESYKLITIGPSHYCEKARWALDFVGTQYSEEKHPPMIHWGWSLPSGGGRTVPILVVGDRVIGDSTEILHFLDEQHGNERRLFPTGSELRQEVDELEDLFDSRLGPHTRRIAYFHLLPHRSLTLPAVSPGVGAGQRMVFSLGFPVFRWLMRRGMNINPISAERSVDFVRQVFAAVEKRLADGREFLVGETFSAADLSFAALAAPVLLPSRYGAALPSLDQFPDAAVELINGFRTTVAGQFAHRLYEGHR